MLTKTVNTNGSFFLQPNKSISLAQSLVGKNSSVLLLLLMEVVNLNEG